MLIRIFHVQFLSAGKGCTAYDVIINPTFLKKVQTSELFEAFLMTVLFEGLEQKYDVDLERSKFAQFSDNLSYTLRVLCLSRLDCA